ncbi:hypothetical protein GJA_1383 [Janthinobacterium agaricidamnosum NBRC 102515 = DSM 9628]|uniref:Uncharacterized protein n=1 Tax=Janthinobacterium agaricidamnosum NBRC 102515 = DSM 9628 TaxID=1349767 RepID=W0V2D5_9BURK|nr:hypothetical protein GJA_1383 [Janthinobacterium agaricidamnosum NBRC 102515 = DSM 9628]
MFLIRMNEMLNPPGHFGKSVVCQFQVIHLIHRQAMVYQNRTSNDILKAIILKFSSSES